MSSVVVDGLHKRFPNNSAAAVCNASFEAPAGGITTLLGPSGSGKTTILRIIAGLESADHGRVLVGGEDVSPIPVQKRGFGFVFQSFALFDHMTVHENIAFGLRTHDLLRVPPGLHNDEVAYAEITETVTQGRLAIFFPENIGNEGLAYYFACLLYPFPSPRDLPATRMPPSACKKTKLLTRSTSALPSAHVLLAPRTAPARPPATA